MSDWTCTKCGTRWRTNPPTFCPYCAEPDYPEHEKLHRAKKELGTEHIGAFLEWLSQDGTVLARWGGEDELTPTREPIVKILARYARIDLDKVEEEKRAMLDALRKPTL